MKRMIMACVVLSWASWPAMTSAAAKKVPDLSGTYDIATLTPLQRPEAFGDKLYMSPEEAKKVEERARAAMADGQQDSDPNREAPPAGGDGSSGASGNVGGYNSFWIDNGETAALVDGKFRTSIIHDPVNGRQPPMTPYGMSRAARFFAMFRPNEGEAWWYPGPGPWDNPESTTLSDRCLLGFSSTGGPPMLPALYNNLHRIVQTEDDVMILSEMVHDARIVRMNSEHAPADVRKWLGDSIGWWEGDTLVVDTTNFRDTPALYLAGEDLHVVERFRKLDDNTLLYSFTVKDPKVWTTSFSGEYPWPRTEDRLFEYACHEGNIAMGNMLRGARILEADKAAEKSGAAAGGQ